MSEEKGIRLSKLMARRGVASRRAAEQMIADGLVVVNGEVVKTVVPVDPDVDHIRVAGRQLPPEPEMVYFLLYKPRGYITSRIDEQGRKTVFELLGDMADKVEAVGRLDFDTEGALLFTNDGDLAHQLTHPSQHVPKRYRAKVYRTPSPKKIESIEKGKVRLDDGPVAAAKVRVIEQTGQDNCWIEITITEGRNRLIRRLFAQLHHPVSKLRRESFATVSIRDMERGQFRRLTPTEVSRLHDLAEGKRPDRAGKSKSRKGFAKAKPKRTRISSKARAKAKLNRK